MQPRGRQGEALSSDRDVPAENRRILIWAAYSGLSTSSNVTNLTQSVSADTLNDTRKRVLRNRGNRAGIRGLHCDSRDTAILRIVSRATPQFV